MATIEQTSASAVQIGGARTVSWGAIFSGVSVATALYFVLLILGTGLGFSVVSPWNFQEYASGTIGLMAVFWIILTQLISSGGGGYIAGRLSPAERTAGNQKVLGAHFYQIAHGLVVWALSTMAIAFLLGTAASNILAGGTSMIAAVGKGAAIGAGTGAIYLGSTLALPDLNGKNESESSSGGADNIISYALDSLLRPQLSPGADSDSQRAARHDGMTSTQKKEVARIFITSIQKNEMSDTDKKYVAQLVSERTGMSQAEALKRVDETLEQIYTAADQIENQARETLDTAREAAAVAALWTFATLLCGALIAAFAACYGGSWNQRHLTRSQK